MSALVKAAVALDGRSERLLLMQHPEARFVVEVNEADEVVCRAPDQPEQRMSIAHLGSVYVETNDGSLGSNRTGT